MTEPTTDAMVEAAQDAYDVAAAEAAVAHARWMEAVAAASGPGWHQDVTVAAAKYQIARRAKVYAHSVLVSVKKDRSKSAVLA